MTIQEQINSIKCSGNGVKGTGLAGCRIDRKRVTALGLLRKGTIFTSLMERSYLESLIQSEKLIMLQGVVTFEDNTADDNIITRAGSGNKVVAGKNPYEYTATFDNGINFHKALTSLSGYENYDMILFDVDGNIFCTTTKLDEPKGFTLGMFENGKYMGANGTDAASQTVTFQLIERAEVDERMSWFSADSLDFSPSELKGINETTLSVVPIVAGNSMIVKVMLLDKTHPVEGLTVGDFLILKNNVPQTVSAVTYTPSLKYYTLTIPAVLAGNILTVSLNGVSTTMVGSYFKSNTVTAVVS